MKRLRRSKSFTLVEILIVIAIIALLAAMAIPNLLRAKVNANDASAKAILKSISNALESYYASNTAYPIDPSVLVGAAPPYLSKNYFVGTFNGYTFSHYISAFDYSVVASPVSVGQTGTTVFTITTGGIIWQ